MTNRKRLANMALVDMLDELNTNILRVSESRHCISEALTGTASDCGDRICADCISEYLNREEGKNAKLSTEAGQDRP